MTVPPRHPRFERAAAALRENLKRRKAQSRARVTGEGSIEVPEVGPKKTSDLADSR